MTKASNTSRLIMEDADQKKLLFRAATSGHNQVDLIGKL